MSHKGQVNAIALHEFEQQAIIVGLPLLLLTEIEKHAGRMKVLH